MERYYGAKLTEVILQNNPTNSELVLITHDESTFVAYDGKCLIWHDKEKKTLKPKGEEACIMILTFLCLYHDLI